MLCALLFAVVNISVLFTMTGFMLARATAALPRRLFSSKKLLSTLVPLEDEFPG